MTQNWWGPIFTLCLWWYFIWKVEGQEHFCFQKVIKQPSEKQNPYPSVQFSRSVVSNSLQPCGLQHTRLPYASRTPRDCSTQVCWVCDAIQPSHPLSSPSQLLPSVFPSISVFSKESFFIPLGQSIGSFSFSISPSSECLGLISLALTGWISLQSKGLSRVFSNTIVQKHQFLVLSFLYSPALTSIHDYWKNQSVFD